MMKVEKVEEVKISIPPIVASALVELLSFVAGDTGGIRGDLDRLARRMREAGIKPSPKHRVSVNGGALLITGEAACGAISG